MADLLGSQQPVVGTSAAVRVLSGALEVDVALTPASVPELRNLVTSSLRLWGLADFDARVVPAATELLRNAEQYARSAESGTLHVKLVLERILDGVFLSVSDPGPKFRHAGSNDQHGLAHIKKTSDGFGCDLTASGKDIWVTFLRPNPSAAACGP
ncbi:ATP-binding protein [Streptomyces sp. NPDC001939]